MKKIFIIIILSTLSAFSQTSDEYVKRFQEVGNYLRDNGIRDFNSLDLKESAYIFRIAGGIDANLTQTSQLKDQVRRLDTYIDNKPGLATVAALQSIFGFLNATDAAKLAGLINSNSKSPSPQAFIAGIAAGKFRIPLIELRKAFESFLREASRPARPDSPNSLSLKRVMSRANKIQRIRFPKTSGDYFSNLYTSLDYVYTEFEDTSTNTRGQIHDFSLNIHGTLFDNTDLSFGILGSEYEAHSVGEDRNKTVGGDFLIHHKLTENYGVGIYGYFQETDYEEENGNAWGAGVGALFTTWHDLGLVELSTVHTITTAHYEYGHDNIWVSNAALTRYWTDWFSTTISAGFTDSVRHDDVGDNTYWTLGGSLGFLIGDKLHLSLGFESDVKIKDYKNEVYRISLSYHF